MARSPSYPTGEGNVEITILLSFKVLSFFPHGSQNFSSVSGSPAISRSLVLSKFLHDLLILI